MSTKNKKRSRPRREPTTDERDALGTLAVSDWLPDAAGPFAEVVDVIRVLWARHHVDELPAHLQEIEERLPMHASRHGMRVTVLVHGPSDEHVSCVFSVSEDMVRDHQDADAMRRSDLAFSTGSFVVNALADRVRIRDEQRAEASDVAVALAIDDQIEHEFAVADAAAAIEASSEPEQAKGSKGVVEEDAQPAEPKRPRRRRASNDN